MVMSPNESYLHRAGILNRALRAVIEFTKFEPDTCDANFNQGVRAAQQEILEKIVEALG